MTIPDWAYPLYYCCILAAILVMVAAIIAVGFLVAKWVERCGDNEWLSALAMVLTVIIMTGVALSLWGLAATILS